MNDEYKIIEERNVNLILENRKLNEEIHKLRVKNHNLYHSLVNMKNDMDNHFDKIGKTYFADDFYEKEED
jgi:hypothetical protein